MPSTPRTNLSSTCSTCQLCTAFLNTGILTKNFARCLQLTVTGSGTASPPASALAAIPGVYQMSDPSIDIDVYSQPGVTVRLSISFFSFYDLPTHYQIELHHPRPCPMDWLSLIGWIPRCGERFRAVKLCCWVFRGLRPSVSLTGAYQVSNGRHQINSSWTPP